MRFVTLGLRSSRQIGNIAARTELQSDRFPCDAFFSTHGKAKSSKMSAAGSGAAASASALASNAVPVVSQLPPLFVDLDGVLADFEAGMIRVSGHKPEDFRGNKGPLSISQMWRAAANDADFFGSLPLMPDAMQLWKAVQPYNPVVLTGKPLGAWPDAQKKSWCARHLGPTVPVIVCMKKEKAAQAAEWVRRYTAQHAAAGGDARSGSALPSTNPLDDYAVLVNNSNSGSSASAANSGGSGFTSPGGQHVTGQLNRDIRPAIGVLVDDSADAAEAWEAAGGIFVHHTSAAESIAKLRKLGYDVR